MHSTPLTPLLASLSGIITGLLLTLFTAFANAQSIPEIQQLMKQGKSSQALEKVDTLLIKKPKDAQARFQRGLILTDMGRQSEAIAVFTKLTEDFPELPEPYNNLAVLYAQEKRYDKARQSLEMAIRTHPSYSIAHENLGDVYAKLVSQAYDKALQLDSSNAKTQTKLSMIKELIGTSSPLAAKPQPASKPAAPEPVKVAVAEPAKATPASQKTIAPHVESTPPKVKAPVEKKPEPAPPAEKAPASANSEAEIVNTLHAWAGAWTRKDVKVYLGFYATSFQTPNGMPRKAWEAQRDRRIDKPGKLQVSLDDIKVTINGDKATARFRQHYTSATLKSSTGKTIDFVKSGGKWLIHQERVN